MLKEQLARMLARDPHEKAISDAAKTFYTCLYSRLGADCEEAAHHIAQAVQCTLDKYEADLPRVQDELADLRRQLAQLKAQVPAEAK